MLSSTSSASYISNNKDHYYETTNNLKFWNIERITKILYRHMKLANAVGKIAPIVVSNAGLQQTFSCKKENAICKVQ